ncbi:MAG: hypothetical protein V4531_05965 [Actinomycetota bacterium]
MSKLSRTALTTLFAGAALAFALTGCTAAGSGTSASATPAPTKSAQSKTAACTSLETSVKASTTELASSFGSIATDPGKAVGGLQSVADAFDSGLAKLSNAQVKAAGTAANDSIKEMILEVKGLVANPSGDTGKLKTAVTAVQTEFTAIGKLCS